MKEQSKFVWELRGCKLETLKLNLCRHSKYRSLTSSICQIDPVILREKCTKTCKKNQSEGWQKMKWPCLHFYHFVAHINHEVRYHWHKEKNEKWIFETQYGASLKFGVLIEFFRNYIAPSFSVAKKRWFFCLCYASYWYYWLLFLVQSIIIQDSAA